MFRAVVYFQWIIFYHRIKSFIRGGKGARYLYKLKFTLYKTNFPIFLCYWNVAVGAVQTVPAFSEYVS